MYSFTGSSRSRPMINLGGQSPNTSSMNPTEIMRKAKEERQLREHLKRQQTAVSTIQAFWRSRRIACQTKVELRKRFDHLINSVIPSSSNQSTLPEHHLTLSRLILVFFTPSDYSDHERLVQWANELILLRPTPPYRKYAMDNSLLGKSWKDAILPIMIDEILNFIAYYPRSEHSLLLLEAVKEIMSTSNPSDILCILRRVSPDEYWRRLRAHILAFDLNEKVDNRTISVALSLSLLPIQLKSDALIPPETLQSNLRCFLIHIFSIPTLPNRLELKALIEFSSALPFNDLLDVFPQPMTKDTERTVHLLSNVLTWGSKLLDTMNSSAFGNYLRVINLSLEVIPTEFFERVDAYLDSRTSTKTHHSAPETSFGFTAIVQSTPAIQIPQQSNEDVSMTNTSSASNQDHSWIRLVNFKTLGWISTLISTDHFTKLYTLSTKFATSCRRSFCRTIVAVLYAWPMSRERIFNTLVSTNVSGAGGGINGLMRELWRFAIRGGKVRLTLHDRKSGGSPQGVLTALNDMKMAGEWEDLIVLSELYSRCLMTLGDDEFFNDETKVTIPMISSSQQTNDVISTGRNPLILDEVIGLAGLLRNLAFGLYWTEGQADIKQGHVIGTRVGLEQLRNLATRLLQQIYTRDSRRPFCEPGFWLMTSTFDLQSFIQTVVYEESHLEEIRNEPHEQTTPYDFVDPDLDLLDHVPSPPGRSQRERVSKRQLAFISPRLGVLNNIPFVIPFEQRVAIFRTFVQSDRHRLGLDLHPFGKPKHRAVIRRGRISEDGFLHLNALGPRLKDPIEIKFIDQYGLEEAGIDGGGVFKEFLTSLTKDIFDTNKGLWLVNQNQELYPNPHTYSQEPLSLEWYGFLGRVLGKALYEGILIDVEFADFFLNKWLGKQSYLDDLASLDPELYQGLLFLKNYKGDVEADLSLNFTLTSNEFDQSDTIELIPNGSKISVTARNRINYIYLISNYKLNVQFEAQCAAFFKGLNDIVELKWLRMFNQVEIKALIGGLDGQDLDFGDLERFTVYGGWDESHETIRIFWRVVKRFDNPTKRKLLKFVTSCSRPPLLGFKELRPAFAIRSSGVDESRLPSASTCVNLLKLPEYKSESQLEEKLLYAINAGAGFDLS
ncbi:hypothetical protein DFH28DRAFT_392310 [Melampsora americana]|nr:hypothetical protein DFH28DRAFT_392310 [Melampsora americana]